jgi:hypothetical protein
MKTLTRIPVVVGASVWLTLALVANAQPYSITSSTIDGGGGTSTNSQYSLSGTIGQPDAGTTLTNGQYSVTGGFWALPQAVQTPGAPLLSIAPAGPGQAQISWEPETGTDWVLQQTPTLSPASWSDAPTGTTNNIVVPATDAARFYRLNKP